eukprot:TRINITY_DN59464_c0_g1_i1.p1 TRINITY_DN59464_c0_g1~~TRINITY_DN59464_c0_g1_i1.p1  ORF type:complete len:566 (-),score=68.01 TRINITY_DN59464_c0_g1_i1:181-1878(-)
MMRRCTTLLRCLVVLTTFSTVISVPVSLTTVINPEGEGVIPLRTQPVFRLQSADGSPEAYPGATITLSLAYANPPATLHGTTVQSAAGPDFLFSDLRISSAGSFQIKASVVLSSTLVLETTTLRFELSPPIPTQLVILRSPTEALASIPFPTQPQFQLINEATAPVPFAISCAVHIETGPDGAQLLGNTTIFPAAPPDSFPLGAQFQFTGLAVSLPGEYRLEAVVNLLGNRMSVLTNHFTVVEPTKTATLTLSKTPTLTKNRDTPTPTITFNDASGPSAGVDTTDLNVVIVRFRILYSHFDEASWKTFLTNVLKKYYPANEDNFDGVHIFELNPTSEANGTIEETTTQTHTTDNGKPSEEDQTELETEEKTQVGDVGFAFGDDNSDMANTFFVQACNSIQVSLVWSEKKLCIPSNSVSDMDRIAIMPHHPTITHNISRNTTNPEDVEETSGFLDDLSTRELVILIGAAVFFLVALILTVILLTCGVKSGACCSHTDSTGVRITDFVDNTALPQTMYWNSPPPRHASNASPCAISSSPVPATSTSTPIPPSPHHHDSALKTPPSLA